MAFFELLRCGEFMSQNHSTYYPTVYLSFSDVAVDDRNFPSFVRLTVKESKTDHFRHGRLFTWGKQIVKCVLLRHSYSIYQFRGAALGPLFLSNNLKPLTQVAFSSAVSRMLKEIRATSSALQHT